MKAIHLLAALGGLMLVAIFAVAGINNSLVNLEEGVNAQWGNVETQYQRRADLVPNLVYTVKGYASHEERVFTEVTEARAAVGKIDISSASQEQIEGYMAAQAQLSGALTKLLAVVESYPDLKASENFLALQAQLEGTENRIGTERHRYNETARDYNRARKGFFTNLVVAVTGLDFQREYPYFEAEEGSNKAPTVNFADEE